MFDPMAAWKTSHLSTCDDNCVNAPRCQTVHINLSNARRPRQTSKHQAHSCASSTGNPPWLAARLHTTQNKRSIKTGEKERGNKGFQCVCSRAAWNPLISPRFTSAVDSRGPAEHRRPGPRPNADTLYILYHGANYCQTSEKLCQQYPCCRAPAVLHNTEWAKQTEAWNRSQQGRKWSFHSHSEQ